MGSRVLLPDAVVCVTLGHGSELVGVGNVLYETGRVAYTCSPVSHATSWPWFFGRLRTFIMGVNVPHSPAKNLMMRLYVSTAK